MGRSHHTKEKEIMPGCGDSSLKIDPSKLTPAPMPSGGSTYSGPYRDPAEFNADVSPVDTNKPFVRDMTYDELEELIEKCVRRVLQGEDIKREFERLKAAEKR